LLSRLPGSLTVQSRDQTVLAQSHIVGVGVGSTVVAEVVVGSVRHGTSLSTPPMCPGAGFARTWGGSGRTPLGRAGSGAAGVRAARCRAGPTAAGGVGRAARWNGTPTRARHDRIGAWLDRSDVDVLAIQELKCKDAQFPQELFTDRGYEVSFHGLNQWNGVAI